VEREGGRMSEERRVQVRERTLFVCSKTRVSFVEEKNLVGNMFTLPIDFSMSNKLSQI
jgi:hypothetical protein